MLTYSAQAMPPVIITAIALLCIPEAASAHIDGSLGSESFFLLLREPLFWIFTFANFALLSTVVSLLSHAGSAARIPERRIGRDMTQALTVLLVVGLAYQMFHMSEHIAQVYQFWHLGKSARESPGILWFFNIEWNHFLFNAGYFALEGVFVIGLLRYLRHRGIALHWIGRMLLIGFLALQGWHLIEHTVRIIEHMTLGCEPCPGILDRLFGWRLIYLHYWLNLLALIFPMSIFVWFGFHRRYLPAHDAIKNRFLTHCCDIGMPALFSFSCTVITLMQVTR